MGKREHFENLMLQWWVKKEFYISLDTNVHYVLGKMLLRSGSSLNPVLHWGSWDCQEEKESRAGRMVVLEAGVSSLMRQKNSGLACSSLVRDTRSCPSSLLSAFLGLASNTSPSTLGHQEAVKQIISELPKLWLLRSYGWQETGKWDRLSKVLEFLSEDLE